MKVDGVQPAGDLIHRDGDRAAAQFLIVGSGSRGGCGGVHAGAGVLGRWRRWAGGGADGVDPRVEDRDDGLETVVRAIAGVGCGHGGALVVRSEPGQGSGAAGRGVAHLDLDLLARIFDVQCPSRHDKLIVPQTDGVHAAVNGVDHHAGAAQRLGLGRLTCRDRECADCVATGALRLNDGGESGRTTGRWRGRGHVGAGETGGGAVEPSCRWVR